MTVLLVIGSALWFEIRGCDGVPPNHQSRELLGWSQKATKEAKFGPLNYDKVALFLLLGQIRADDLTVVACVDPAIGKGRV